MMDKNTNSALGRKIPIMAYKGWLRPQGVTFNFFRLQVYKRVVISLVELYERVAKSCHFGL